ncbi:MAG: cytochrome C, partial [Deltaproteobacteria bacterium]|nr:cytochrome C [Deltaproteobacteria bacterium]
MKKSIVAISLLLMTGISAQATEAPTLSLGKALFESTELGTKGRG